MRVKILSGLKWTSISTIIVSVLNLAKVAIFARFISKEEFGYFAVISLVLSLLEVLNDFGLNSAIIYAKKLTNEILSTILWINVFISIFFTGILLCTSQLIEKFYDYPGLSGYINLLSIIILVSSLGRNFKSLQQKNLNFNYIAKVESAAAIISFVLAIALLPFGFRLMALLISIISFYFITNTIFFIKGISENRIILCFKFRETLEILKVGLFQMGGQIINYSIKDFDIIVIGKIYSAEILGIYSLIKQLSQKPYQIINSIFSKVYAPILARIAGDNNELKKEFDKLNRIIAISNFGVYSLIMLLSFYILKFFYGPDYMGFSYYLKMFSVIMFLRSLSNTIGSLSISLGKTNLEFYLNVILMIIYPLVVIMTAKISIEAVFYGLIFISFFSLFLNWLILVKPIFKESFKNYLLSFIITPTNLK